MKKCLCELTLGIALTCIGPLFAQVPQTDLYLFQLTQDDTLRWHMHSPKLLSSWNAGGYTNQPEWIDDHTLLVSVLRNGDAQNDIYLLDLKEQLRARMTETAESEFSPLLTPDKHHFSVVRQASADPIDQQVYRYPLDLSSAGEPLLSKILNVGYHCWLNADELALFLVDEPAKLAFASLTDGTPRTCSSAIGRSLRKTASGDLAYVHKYSETFWFLKTIDPATCKSDILIETLYGKEDFAIGSTGDYFMASGSTLYVFDPDNMDKKWKSVCDLSIFGLSNIARLALNAKNQIAIVDLKG